MNTSLFYLNANQTRDLRQNGIICQQKDHSLVADRFEASYLQL
jgi:hypothetical protein